MRPRVPMSGSALVGPRQPACSIAAGGAPAVGAAAADEGPQALDTRLHHLNGLLQRDLAAAKPTDLRALGSRWEVCRPWQRVRSQQRLRGPAAAGHGRQACAAPASHLTQRRLAASCCTSRPAAGAASKAHLLLEVQGGGEGHLRKVGQAGGAGLQRAPARAGGLLPVVQPLPVAAAGGRTRGGSLPVWGPKGEFDCFPTSGSSHFCWPALSPKMLLQVCAHVPSPAHLTDDQRRSAASFATLCSRPHPLGPRRRCSTRAPAPEPSQRGCGPHPGGWCRARDPSCRCRRQSSLSCRCRNEPACSKSWWWWWRWWWCW